MLTIQGDSQEAFCDGISRRGFLRIGSLGLGGLAMPQLLNAEAQAGNGKTQKSIIMIFLAGGPPHQDMWDLKMDAPSEIRGEFSPIKTNVPGIEICELFPQMAKISDKLTYIRSIVGAHGGHDPSKGMRDWGSPLSSGSRRRPRTSLGAIRDSPGSSDRPARLFNRTVAGAKTWS